MFLAVAITSPRSDEYHLTLNLVIDVLFSENSMHHCASAEARHKYLQLGNSNFRDASLMLLLPVAAKGSEQP